MKEIETLSFLISPNHLDSQLIILRKNLRNVLRHKCIVLARRGNDRLNGNLLKSQIGKMADIRGKVLVKTRKRPAHIIVCLIPALRHFFKFRNHQIVAALSSGKRTHFVMDFFPSVHAQNNICHLPVGKVNDVIIQQHAVRRQRKTEPLVVRFLKASAICDQILYNLPVHQGFPAKKIHFQVHAAAGVRHKKIQRLLADLVTHKSPSAMVLSLLRKAVPALKVAVMRNMKTECLHDRLTIPKGINTLLIDVLRKKHPVFFQFIYFIDKLIQFFCLIRKFLFQTLQYRLLVRMFKVVLHHAGNHVIDNVINNMYRTAVNIQDNIVSIIFILMYQFLFLPIFIETHPQTAWYNQMITHT